MPADKSLDGNALLVVMSAAKENEAKRVFPTLHPEPLKPDAPRPKAHHRCHVSF